MTGGSSIIALKINKTIRKMVSSGSDGVYVVTGMLVIERFDMRGSCLVI